MIRSTKKKELEDCFPSYKNERTEIMIPRMAALDGFPIKSYIASADLRISYPLNRGGVYWVHTILLEL
jgi:hypothetical protein